jgi:hypothetical protein
MKKTAIAMLVVSGLLLTVGILGGIKTANAMMDTNYFEIRDENVPAYEDSVMPGWRRYQDDSGAYGRPRGMMGWRYNENYADDGIYRGMMGRGSWQEPLVEGEKLDKDSAKKRAEDFIEFHNLDFVVGDISEDEDGYFEINLVDKDSGELELKLIADIDTGLVFPEYCHGNMGRFNGRRNWQ